MQNGPDAASTSFHGHRLGRIAIALCASVFLTHGGPVLAQDHPHPVGDIVGTLPKGHFLENVVAASDGGLFMTDYVGRALIRYGRDDGLRLIRALDVHPVGIARAETGLILTAHTGSLMEGPTEIGPNLILEVTEEGEIIDRFEVPGAVFLNGIAHVRGSEFLVADSVVGSVFLIDVADNSTRTWLHDPRLAPPDPPTPAPAANGVKISNGLAYISNSARGLLLTVPVDDPRPDRMQIVLENTIIDDFVFAADGTIFATTHSTDVLAITPDLQVSVFADEDQNIAGATAAEIVQEPDGTFLYVVGDGGLFEGLPLQAPAVVRLRIDPSDD